MLEIVMHVKENRKEGIPLLKAVAAFLHYPTTGDFAHALWQLCSSNYDFALPPSEAAQLYRDLGYVPFDGYPLQRAA